MSTSPEKTSEKQIFVLRGSETLRYTLFGAIFGFSFPVVGMLLEILYSQLPLNLTSVVTIQKTYSLLWIIETAPIFLGLFAGLAGRRQDKLQQLNNELNLREKELEATQINLEKKIQDRTYELQVDHQIERRASRLQAVLEISQTIALVQNIDDLLPLIASLISERFGFYHVGIFLLDEARENAVLKAANSKGGQRMLARKHQLKLGSTSIVGFATQTGRARTALDIGTDISYFDNPDLPETHSEVALPLKVDDNVIGALDIQSTEIAAFKEDELGVLTILANQVAAAIHNTRLYKETRTALSEAEARNASGKKLALTSQSHTGFTYAPDGTFQSAPAILADNANNSASNQTMILDAASGVSTPTMHVPVKLRDQIVGFLNIQSNDPNRNWSEDEVALVQTISERAAFALENARLFEEAQRRASKERIIGEISTKIGSVANIDNIIETAVRELGRTMPDAEIAIQFQSKE